MAFLTKTAKTLRNNWKKSTLASVLLYYGANWASDHFETEHLMRNYCERAAKYGEQTLTVSENPRSVTVILNPSANKRKAADEFQKYCAPILHLAGICVNVIKTESEGHARTLISDLKSTDAIVVAGGDGTLSEVITGLLRRTNENTNGLVPLGILPLGRTNSVAKVLFSSGGNAEKVRALADATMAVVEEVIQPLHVLKIESIEDENKPIYAVSGIKWGAYRDAECKKDSYWVYGGYRKYATYLFNGYKNSLSWKCNALLNYSPPCEGCSNCAQQKSSQTKNNWFQRFAKNEPNASNIINPSCEIVQNKDISTVDFTLSVPASEETTPKLVVNIGPQSVDYLDFIKEGWKSENGEERDVKEVIEARAVEIRPEIVEEKEAWFSIDNENYELKPIKVTLLPKLINVFCRKDPL